MIRQPVTQQRTSLGSQSSYPTALPPPTGGWNVRDPLASMPAKDASLLDNLFPRASDVTLRSGCVQFVGGFATSVQTLLPFEGPSSSKLFASTSSGIYEVTSGSIGALGLARGSGRHRYVNFATTAGGNLIAVNGTDDIARYDGTSWTVLNAASTPAITGITSNQVVNVAVACSRLWFVVANNNNAYYLPVGQIGGAVSAFPLGQVFVRGGRLIAVGNWTIDGGSGMDDYTLFMSSEGEVAVYKGTDPASINTFSKVGVYFVGEPLNYNCFTKYGGDVLILCRTGLFPLSKALQSASVSYAMSLTDKINTAFSDAVAEYGNFADWQCVVYPEGNFVLVNIPVTASYHIQYVMNSVTGAWCRFTGIEALNWVVWDNKLYFASYTLVGQAWTGQSDFGADIVGKCRQAYNYFGSRSANKLIHLVSPVVSVDNIVNAQLGFDVDFLDSELSLYNVAADAVGSAWDSGTWDSAIWGAGYSTYREWTTVTAPVFYTAAFRLQVSTNKSKFFWSSTNFLGELAGIL